MKELKLFTANGIQQALSNLTYSKLFTVNDILDAAEDSTNGTQLMNRLRAMGLCDQMSVALETDYRAHIRIIDCFGNASYLKARKG